MMEEKRREVGTRKRRWRNPRKEKAEEKAILMSVSYVCVCSAASGSTHRPAVPISICIPLSLNFLSPSDAFLVPSIYLCVSVCQYVNTSSQSLSLFRCLCCTLTLVFRPRLYTAHTYIHSCTPISDGVLSQWLLNEPVTNHLLIFKMMLFSLPASRGPVVTVLLARSRVMPV